MDTSVDTLIQELQNGIKNTRSEMVSVIGADQLDTIRNLQQEIESLKRIISIKDDLLAKARSKAIPRTHINIDNINNIIQLLFDKCPHDQSERKQKLEEIENVDDASVKVDKLFSFLLDDAKLNESQISRLSQQLTGCVSVFEQLVSDSPILAFTPALTESQKSIIMKNAKETNSFINELMRDGEIQMYTIDQQLNLNIDTRKRMNKIIKLLGENNDLSTEELKDMLYLELATNDILRKAIKDQETKLKGKLSSSVAMSLKPQLEAEYQRKLNQAKKDLEKQMKQDSAQLEEELKPKIEKSLRPKIEREARTKLISELKPQIEKEMRTKLAEEIKPQLRIQLSQEIEEQTKAKVEKQLRKQIEDETNQRIQEELENQIKPQLESELQKQVEEQIKPQLRKQIEEQMRAKLEKELSPKIESKVRPQIEESIRRKLELQLRPKITQEIKQQSAEEHTQKLEEMESDLREQIELELRESIENELRASLEQEITEKVERKLRPQIELEIRNQARNEYNQKLANKKESIEKSLRYTIQKELRPKIRAELQEEFEKQKNEEKEAEIEVVKLKVKDDLEDQLRGELENSIRQELEEEMKKEQEKSRKQMQQDNAIYLRNAEEKLRIQLQNSIPERDNAQYNDTKPQQINYPEEKTVQTGKEEQLFKLIREGLGLSQKEYTYMRFIKNTERLANDCCSARRSFSLKDKTFTQVVSDLVQLNGSLEQRITQDRALFVKQADEISKLRLSVSDNQWNKWAANVFYLLSGEYFRGDDSYMLRDMIDEIVDENASFITIKRKADKLRSPSGSPPELTPSPLRELNRTPSLYSSPLRDSTNDI